MNSPPTGRRERFADALGQHAHLCIIIGAVVLMGIYGIRKDFGSLTQTAFIGDSAKFLTVAVGFMSGVLALTVMGLLTSADFPKLAQFQVYIILGIGLSTLASGIVILNTLAIIRFRP